MSPEVSMKQFWVALILVLLLVNGCAKFKSNKTTTFRYSGGNISVEMSAAAFISTPADGETATKSRQVASRAETGTPADEKNIKTMKARQAVFRGEIGVPVVGTGVLTARTLAAALSPFATEVVLGGYNNDQKAVFEAAREAAARYAYMPTIVAWTPRKVIVDIKIFDLSQPVNKQLVLHKELHGEGSKANDIVKTMFEKFVDSLRNAE